MKQKKYIIKFNEFNIPDVKRLEILHDFRILRKAGDSIVFESLIRRPPMKNRQIILRINRSFVKEIDNDTIFNISIGETIKGNRFSILEWGNNNVVIYRIDSGSNNILLKYSHYKVYTTKGRCNTSGNKCNYIKSLESPKFDNKRYDYGCIGLDVSISKEEPMYVCCFSRFGRDVKFNNNLMGSLSIRRKKEVLNVYSNNKGVINTGFSGYKIKSLNNIPVYITKELKILARFIANDKYILESRGLNETSDDLYNMILEELNILK